MRRMQFFEGALAAIALSFFVLPDAQANTYTVNTSSDSVVANACENHLSGCSLRGAILAADGHSGDTIVFAISEFCGPNGCAITLSSVLPDISAPMSILGPTRHAIQRGSSAATNFGIFKVTTTGTVNISDLTIKQGHTGGATNGGGLLKLNLGTVNVTNCVFQGNFASNGGGISNRGTLIVTNCTFTGNGAGNGGGIYNDGGTINVTNCTFTGNGAGGNGGGIANDHYGTAHVSNSTFSGNFANQSLSDPSGGGAICDGDHDTQYGGYMTVTNSTITGNTARRGGGLSIGGAAAGGFLTVTNCTVVGNSTYLNGTGGGISSDSQGPVNIKNTIVALNTGATMRDVYGIFVSSGFNLIGQTDGSTGFTQATDQVGTIASPLDPKLDPAGLQNNGGPIQTIALLFGSPAIDKGTSNGLTGALTTDQRGNGFPRALDYSSVTNAAGGDGTDIGAIEFGGPLVPISVSRKVHGPTPFDIALPLSGTAAGVECRSGGAPGNHQLILNFPASVSLTSASVTTGTGSINNYSVNGPDVTVNLTGVANAQTIVVTLFGVSDRTNTRDVTVPMGVLLGDTSGNGLVNASDVSQTKGQSGNPVTASGFREDVNTNGAINASDVSAVKTKSGTALP